MTNRVNNKHQNTAVYIGVGVLLLVSMAIRLYQLGSGLWFDEIMTLKEYARLPYLEIVTRFESENQHFLYSLLAHSSILLFGESAWSLRLPAVLFGVGSIWAVYMLGTEVTDRKQAFLASALLAFSYHHLWFSQNARGYTGLLFWTLVSSWLLLRTLRKPDRRDWILYAVTSALGAYTHLTMGFVIAGQLLVCGLVMLARYRRKEQVQWIDPAAGFALAGILILFLHIPVIGQMQSVIGGSEVSVVTEWKNPLWTLSQFLQGLRVSSSTGLAGFIFLLVAFFGLVSYWNTRPEFVGLLLLPPIIGAVVTVGIGHHLWPRFFFFTFGFAVLVVIRGVFAAAHWISRKINTPKLREDFLGSVLSVSLIILSAFSMVSAYGPKQDFGEALEFLESNRTYNDRIVVVSLTSLPYRDYYQKDWKEIKSAGELEEIISEPGKTWLVYTFPEVLGSTYPDVMSLIRQEFSLVKKFPGTVQSGTVYVVLHE